MPKPRKILTGAASGALAAVPSGNPFLIGGSALIGAIPGVFESERKFDENPFRTGFEKMERAARRRARRSAEEVGATSRANAASRGIAGSELSQSVTEGAMRGVRQRTDDILAQQEANLEDRIAHAKTYIDQANQAEARKDWTSLANAVIGTANKIGTEPTALGEKLGIKIPKKPSLYDLFNRDSPPTDSSNPFKPKATPGNIFDVDDTETDMNPRPPLRSGKMSFKDRNRQQNFRNIEEEREASSQLSPEQKAGMPDADVEISDDGTEIVSPMQEEKSETTTTSTPTTTAPTATAPTATATAERTPEQVKQFLADNNIHEGSRIGKLFLQIPKQMGILESVFGLQYLVDALTL